LIGNWKATQSSANKVCCTPSSCTFWLNAKSISTCGSQGEGTDRKVLENGFLYICFYVILRKQSTFGFRRNDKKKRRTAFGYRNYHSLPFVNPRAFSFSEAVRKWCCTLDNLDSCFRGNDKPSRTDTDQLDYFHNAFNPYGKRDCNSLNLYIY
jgi:hypothetical protein